MKLFKIADLAPVVASDDPQNLTYNGKMPEYHVITELVWHPRGNEILQHRCIALTPCQATADCIEDELEDYLTPVFDDLPTRGVWRVVVAGTMDGEFTYEYDSWVNWEILSANKFPSFGALKEWFKEWKKEQ